MTMKSIDECGDLLARARELLLGRYEYGGWKANGVNRITWDFAQTAMIRAAAVLTAAVVNHLADELDERDAPGMTDEELDEALRSMEDNNVDANLPQTPETANSETDNAPRKKGKAPPQPEDGADGEHSDEASKVA